MAEHTNSVNTWRLQAESEAGAGPENCNKDSAVSEKDSSKASFRQA